VTKFRALGEGVSLKRGRQIEAPPLKIRYFAAIGFIVWKRLQIHVGTDLLHTTTSTGYGIFRFININDLERPWSPKRGVLLKFSQFLAAAHISTLNCDQTAGDRPRQIFSIERRF